MSESKLRLFPARLARAIAMSLAVTFAAPAAKATEVVEASASEVPKDGERKRKKKEQHPLLDEINPQTEKIKAGLPDLGDDADAKADVAAKKARVDAAAAQAANTAISIAQQTASGQKVNIGEELTQKTANASLAAGVKTARESKLPFLDVMTGNVGYNDAESDPQGTHVYQWYTATDAAGTTRTPIAGATADTFTLTGAEQGKYLVFEVTPMSTVAPTTGTTVRAVTSSAIPGTSPTATPTLTGTFQVGATFDAHSGYDDADNDAESGTLYQYCMYRLDNSFVSCGGQVSQHQNIPLISANQNRRIAVRVTPKSATGINATGAMVESAKSVLVEGRAPVANPSITGTVAQGEVLTGVPNVTDADGDTHTLGGHTYRWYRATDSAGTNRTLIAGATTTTYTIQAADANHYLVFEVVPKTSTGTPDTGVAASAVTASMVAAASAPTAAPTITGPMQTGQAMTGHVGYDDAENDPEGTHVYQWYTATDAAGTTRTPISDATASTYMLTGDEQGKYLVFEVTPVSTVAPTTGTPVRAVTATAVPGSAPVMTNLRIEGTRATVGSTVRLEYDFNDAEDDAESSTYSWCRKGVTCNIGTARQYVIQAADVGRQLDAQVTPRTSTGTPNSAPTQTAPGWPASGTIQNEAAPTMTTPTITGTMSVSQILTGTPQGYEDANGDLAGVHTYKWYRADDAAGTTNKVLISGATSASYTIAAADKHKYLVFEVTPVAATGAPNIGTAVSRVTATAVPGTAPTMTTPNITGTTTVGQDLTGVPQGYDDAEDDGQGVHIYKWYRADDAAGTTNKVAISGATSTTYTIVAADTNKYLVFEVTPVAATGTPNVGTPISRVTATSVEPPVSASPAVTALERTLTGVVNYSGPPAGTHTYQWYRSNVASGTPRTAISGATAIGYTATDADSGKYLVFEVTPRSASGTVGSTVSAVSTEQMMFFNSIDYAIPDSPGGPGPFVNSPITVSGMPGTASTVRVEVNIQHPYRSDLVVQLVAPDGTEYMVHNREGVASDIYQYYQIALSNEARNGTWYLRVNDHQVSSAGFIRLWSLKF